MIELTRKTEQDFLNPKLIYKFREVGIDFNDAKYCIIKRKYIDTLYILAGNELNWQAYVVNPQDYEFVCPTYSFAELLYKLPEWHPQYGSLAQCKDAPFYAVYYKGAPTDSPMNCISEYPIEAAAQLLINCVATGLGIVKDISNK